MSDLGVAVKLYLDGSCPECGCNLGVGDHMPECGPWRVSSSEPQVTRRYSVWCSLPAMHAPQFNFLTIFEAIAIQLALNDVARGEPSDAD